MSSAIVSTKTYSGPTRDLRLTWQDQTDPPSSLTLELQNATWLTTQKSFFGLSSQFEEDASNVREVTFSLNPTEKQIFHFSKPQVDAQLIVTFTLDPDNPVPKTHNIRILNDSRIHPHMNLELHSAQDPEMFYSVDAPTTVEELSSAVSHLVGISYNFALTAADKTFQAGDTLGRAASRVGALVQKLWYG